jgi:hypothetical protein
MENRKYFYSAYGIKISSEIRIPELSTCKEKKTQVKIEYGEVKKPSKKEEKYSSVLEKKENGFLCYINKVGGVKVKDGSKIIVSPESRSTETGFRFLVSGVALGLLLHLRGLTTLHASAAAVHGHAVAFIGHSGTGKSTTAAALHARGHPIVTDDLLVLNTHGDSVQAYPGFPHLKLTPESIAQSVHEDPNRIPKIDPEGPKHSLAAEKNFLEDPLPLQCIYTLAYRAEPGDAAAMLPYSEDVQGKEAIIELVRNSYVARLFPEEAISEQHLKCSARLAQTVPVRRLHRKNSLGDLQNLAALIDREQTRV